MPNCPKCQKPLTDADVARRRCPACDSVVGDESMGSQANLEHTIDITSQDMQRPATVDLAVQRTMDLPPMIPGVDDSGSSSADRSPIEQTLDSTPSVGSHDQVAHTIDSVQLSSPDGPSNLTNHYGQTLDGTPSAEGVGRRLNALWGSADASGQPHVTMRGASPLDDEDGDSKSSQMTLVIRERNFRGESDQRVANADYDILEVLGEGGMGVVYRARQASIDREVAVKMLRPEMGINESTRRKFLSEAAVTGELDHPNIVPIYDLGQNADGALFYSMKKVQGTPWSKVIKEKSVLDNLTILMKVSDAVAFAHARGVVHRDLKPENVMLGDFGEVLVLDWGLAVATEGHRETPNVSAAYNIAGTPAYMSPELASGPMEEIGKHSDVYLLGAILYEIITGVPPHTGRNARVCLGAAARNEIVPTEKRGELVDIARKALETDPAKRHPSVQAFQEAIRQYQAHSESISLCEKAQQDLRAATRSDDYRDYARAVFAFEEAYALWNGNDSALAGASRAKLHYAGSALHKHDYDLGLSLIDEKDPEHAEVRQLLLDSKKDRDARQQRLKRAKRIVVGLLVAIFAAVSVGIVLVSIFYFEADRQRIEAEEARVIAGQKAEEARQNAEEARQNAEKARQKTEEAEKNFAEAEEARVIAKTNADNALAQEKIAKQRQAEAEYEAYGALIGMAAAKISENAFKQASEALEDCLPHLRGWEWGRLSYVVRQGQRRQLPTTGRPECLAFHPAGTLVATGTHDGVVQIWDWKKQELKGERRFEGSGAAVTALAFSPQGDGPLAIGTNVAGQYLQLWNWQAADNAAPLTNVEGHTGMVSRVSFSRDGARLLTASHDHTARLWEVKTAKPLKTFKGHSWLVWSAVFSPDETQIATASEDGTIRLWDTESAAELKTPAGERIPFMGHRGPVYAVAFLPAMTQRDAGQSSPVADEQRSSELQIVSAGYDKRVLLWNPNELVPFDFRRLQKGEKVKETPFKELLGHAAAVRDLSCSADGSRILSASNDQTLRLWYARDRDVGSMIVKAGSLDKELRGHDGPVQAAAFSPVDNEMIASASHDGSVRLWKADEYGEELAIPGFALRGHQDAVMAARFSQDGTSIVTASRDRTAKKWRAADGKEEVEFREGHAYLTSRALFDLSRKRLLTAAVDGTVRVWSLETESQLFVLEKTGFRAAVAIDPRGRWIMTGSNESSGTTDGAQTGTSRWGAILWNAADGKHTMPLEPLHKAAISCVAFSADGRWAYSGDDRGTGHLWDAMTGQHLARLDAHIASVTGAIFAPDHSTLYTSSTDKLVYAWDLRDPTNVQPMLERVLKHDSPINSIALNEQGDLLVAGCENSQISLWNLPSLECKSLGKADRQHNVNSVSLSLDGRWLIAVDSQSDEVRLINLTSFEERVVLRLRERDAIGWSAAFMPQRAADPSGDSPSFVTVGGDEARLWNSQGMELANFSPHRPIAFVDLSQPDGKRLVTAGWDHSARIWDAQTGAPLITLNDHTAGKVGGHKGPVNCAVFSPDGKHVLTASEDGTIRLWDPDQRLVVKKLEPGRGPVMRAFFTRDGQRLLAAFRDGSITLGPLQGDAVPIVFTGHTQAVLDVAFSPDERFIVSGSADTTARVWDAATGKQLLKPMEGHSGEVTAVAFATDASGKPRVVTGSADRTAKVWDVGALVEPREGDELSTAKELLTLKGHTRGVTSVAFSPVDRAILTAGRDGISIVWPADDWLDNPDPKKASDVAQRGPALR